MKASFASASYLVLLSPLCADHLFCLHGFLRAEGNMKTIERAMTQEGVSVTNWTYKSRAKYIEEHADDLIACLKAHAASHPKEAIHFATHSLGGIIVRAALNHPDCPQEAKIGKAVLIAPPNRGSQFARTIKTWPILKKFLGKHAGKQLMSATSFDHLGQFPETVDVLIIAGTCGFNPFIQGKNDGKVGLDETRLKTPHTHATVFAGHSWICHTDKTVELTKAFLLPPADSAHHQQPQ